MAKSKAKKPRKKEEAGYRLTPKGCLFSAIGKVMPGLVTDDQKDLIWMVFEDLMRKHGYVEDEKK